LCDWSSQLFPTGTGLERSDGWKTHLGAQPQKQFAESPNVVRGPERRFRYNDITRYTLNGVNYTATRDTLTDHLLAASRGLFESVCFDASLAEDPKEYSISHNCWNYKAVDVGACERASLLFINRWTVVAESHDEFSSNQPYASFWGSLPSSLFTASIDACPGFVLISFPFWDRQDSFAHWSMEMSTNQ
jgi:hypothetical protein